MTRTRALLAPLLVALVLVGCSSSGGDSEGAADEVTTTVADDGTTTAPDDETTDTTEATDPGEETTVPDEETTEDTEPSDGGGEVCDALQVISDFDVQSSELIGGASDWSAVQDFLVSSTPDVIAAYDDAIAVADADLAADLTTLRDYTDGVDELAAESTDINDLGSKLLDLPGTMEAGQAGLAVNTYAEETCGFSTGGN